MEFCQHYDSCGKEPCCNNFRKMVWTCTESFLWSLHATSFLQASASRSAGQEKMKATPVPAPDNIETDWIGPPDPDSNLRPVKFFIPPDESVVEKDFRTKREDVMKWNHEYWAKHNKKFIKVRKQLKNFGISFPKTKGPTDPNFFLGGGGIMHPKQNLVAKRGWTGKNSVGSKAKFVFLYILVSPVWSSGFAPGGVW